MSSKVPGRAFVDTSFWFAALEPADVKHGRAGELLTQAREARTRFQTTREVVGETLTLLRYRSTARRALQFLDVVVPTVDLIVADQATHELALAVFRRLAPRRRLSHCDALSFVVVRHLLNDVPCLAFDRDFRALGLTVLA